MNFTEQLTQIFNQNKGQQPRYTFNVETVSDVFVFDNGIVRLYQPNCTLNDITSLEKETDLFFYTIKKQLLVSATIQCKDGSSKLVRIGYIFYEKGEIYFKRIVDITDNRNKRIEKVLKYCFGAVSSMYFLTTFAFFTKKFNFNIENSIEMIKPENHKILEQVKTYIVQLSDGTRKQFKKDVNILDYLEKKGLGIISVESKIKYV